MKKTNGQNQNEYKIIDLTKEYAGYEGDERWAIVSELTTDELNKKYPEMIKEHSPYVLLSVAQGQVIREFNCNEEKFKKRHFCYGDAFGYEESVTERFHMELAVHDFMAAIEIWGINEELRMTLVEAIGQLTEAQRSRVYKYCIQGKTLRDIAAEEGICVNGVNKSIKAGIAKIRQFFHVKGMNYYFN